MHSFISGSRFKKAGDDEASTTAPGEDGVKHDAVSDQAPNLAVASGRVVVIRPSSGVPVAIAVPHQVGMPTVNADVQIVSSPASGTLPESKHVPFDWVNANGLGRKGPADLVPKDHASRVSQAAKVSDVAICLLVGACAARSIRRHDMFPSAEVMMNGSAGGRRSAYNCGEWGERQSVLSGGFWLRALPNNRLSSQSWRGLVCATLALNKDLSCCAVCTGTVQS